MKQLTLFALLVLALFGCANPGSVSENSNSKSADPAIASQDSLRDLVLEVHDAVMPKMGEINRLQRQLRKWKEANPNASTAQTDEVMKTLDWLNKADEGMMDWMAGFSQPENLRDSLSNDAIIAYLAGQQQAVQTVYDDINGSIDAAKQLLEKLNPNQK